MAALTTYSGPRREVCSMACIPGRQNCAAGCCACDQNGNPVPQPPPRPFTCPAGQIVSPDGHYCCPAGQQYDPRQTGCVPLTSLVPPATQSVPRGPASQGPAQCKPDNSYLNSATGISDAARQCCSGRAYYGVFLNEFYCGDANTPDYSLTPRTAFIEGGGTLMPPPSLTPMPLPSLTPSPTPAWVWWTTGGITLLLLLVLILARAAGAGSP